MTKKLSIPLKIAGVLGAATLLLVGFDYNSTKSRLDRISRAHDPAHLELEPAYNSYVEHVNLPDGSQTGIIHLKDGSSAKFWFKSHHLTGDIGGTWFSLSDGTRQYMAGWFCCDVKLPEEQLPDLNALQAFIKQGDGVAP